MCRPETKSATSVLADCPLWPSVGAAYVSRMLKKEKLNATKEEEVLCAFLKWADAPGRELSIIEKIAPLVRFPLVRFPLGDELKAMLKRLCDRSEVVKGLFDLGPEMVIVCA